MSSMPQMEGRAGQHLSWSSLALKALVVLLVPLVVFRFLFVDVWGGLNDAAVPILGLYLLRGEDESFFACYERLSKIWLFNECCGIQKDVTFVSALIVFILISLVCGANDAYLLFCQDPSISRWHSLVAGNGLLNLTCAALAVHMWRVLHGKARALSGIWDSQRGATCFSVRLAFFSCDSASMTAAGPGVLIWVVFAVLLLSAFCCDIRL